MLSKKFRISSDVSQLFLCFNIPFIERSNWCGCFQEKFEKRELRQAMKNFVKSGEGFMTGAFYVLVVLGSIVANFVKQLIVFVFVLFFLITSEAGGVMEQALEVVPLSQVTRQKCATVLDRTISAVLLTTGKLMFFQVTT